jgi:hypothetical protein
MTTVFRLRYIEEPGKRYGLMLVDTNRRVLKTDGTLAAVGDEFDPATFIHPLVPFPRPLESAYEASVPVAEGVEAATYSIFVLERAGDEFLTPRRLDNWHLDPSDKRDVFGALVEPVKVVQTIINQNYAPPMRG